MKCRYAFCLPWLLIGNFVIASPPPIDISDESVSSTVLTTHSMVQKLSPVQELFNKIERHDATVFALLIGKSSMKDEQGNRPLHKAISCKFKALISFLMAQNPSLISTNDDGNTPVHLAVINDYQDVAKQMARILAKMPSIDFSMKNADGFTAYDLAKQKTNQKTWGNVLARLEKICEAVQASTSLSGPKFDILGQTVVVGDVEGGVINIDHENIEGLTKTLFVSGKNVARQSLITGNLRGVTINFSTTNKALVPFAKAKTVDLICQLGKSEKNLISLKIIDYTKIKLGQGIGRGGFGNVFKASWNNEEVAIKQLKSMDDEHREQFLHEVRVWQQSDFPRIVHLYGICIPPNPYCMVMAYMKHGSLYSLLQRETVSLKQSECLAKDIASGLAFIHSKNIIHCDIKSLNILISKEDGMYRAHLADFGLSKFQDKTSGSHIVGSLYWLAPEILDKGAYSKHSDMWAYGMVLYELITAQIPYKSLHADDKHIKKIIMKGELPPIPKKASTLVALRNRCCALKPDNRLTAKQTFDELNESSSAGLNSSKLFSS